MEKCARLEIVCGLIPHLGFKSLTLRHNLSENVSFQIFFLPILHKFASEKGNQRGIHPLFFLISCVKVRDKSADA